jgi:Mannosyl-glycoprotein endo-beta-N-acetylglucosaminidase
LLADTPRDAAAGPVDPAYRRHDEQPAGVPGTAAQQAFISLVAPGAIATQQRYGIPAAVTIAQAIDESGWGRSVLATADHNLFGIKGAGPAGRDMLPTREHENGVWVTRTAPFRMYHNVAESIEDHGRLLATDPAYRHAMASRGRPDAFATALTGVYATDPGYGSSLIALMRLYNLYRYDAATPPAAPPAGQRARPPRLGWRASGPWCRVSLTRRDRPAGTAFRGWPARWPWARCARAQPGAEGGRRRGSRRGVRCQPRAATSRGFRIRSPPTSSRRPRGR